MTSEKVKGHGMYEMPSCAGKSICTLALLLAHIKQATPKRKVVYCVRTLTDLEKIAEELKALTSSQDSKDGNGHELLALSLSTKSNLCIHKAGKGEHERH